MIAEFLSSEENKTNTYKCWKSLDFLEGKSSQPQPNRTIQFNNKDKSRSDSIAQSFNKQFVNSTPHKTSNINRIIDSKTIHVTDEELFQVTVEQVHQAIKSTKNS